MLERGQFKKIAFVGTSCIGKTTLLNEYKRKNPQVMIVGEASSEFFIKNPDIKDRFSFETQGKIQEFALKNERDAHKTGAKIILCDRSVLDAVIYVKSMGDSKGAKELLKRVEFWLPTYDKFLLLNPADIPYRRDSVRQEDEGTRQRFHEAFINFFNETGISYELLSGTVARRIIRVEEIIKG